MAEGVINPTDIITTAQNEAFKLFELAVQVACQKLDQIADEAKIVMEEILVTFEGTRKSIEKQLMLIHEQAIKTINDLIAETEKYIVNIWETAKTKLAALGEKVLALIDPQNITMKLQEFTNFMSRNVSEFNRRLKDHAYAVIELQKQFFDNLQERLTSMKESSNSQEMS